MWNLYDIAYGLGIGVSAPLWATVPPLRRKVMRVFRQQMARDLAPRVGDEPCILIHAVSVGEINATRSLIQALRDGRPGVKFVVSTTTETGYARAQELYGPNEDVRLVRYPFDFSNAVTRALDALRPDVVVLMELEAWPNFIKRCHDRNIPVVLGNARLTTSSFRNYRLAGPLLRSMFQRIALVCAQDQTYAERFLKLGMPPHHVVITGTMKFDTANMSPPSRDAAGYARSVGLEPEEEILWVCGSTGPGEEELILRVYRKLLARFARLRLVIVPRHPQRFDEVARVIEAHRFQCARLTHVGMDRMRSGAAIQPVVLIDTMGVLRDFYSLADVVFVGRSLVDLGARQHGSDMIEPAALAKPIIVGPYTSNFAEAMRKFRDGDALLEAANEESLLQGMSVLLSSPKEAKEMGQRAATVVRLEQGATARHARVILQILTTHRGEAPVLQPVRHAAPVAPAEQEPVRTMEQQPYRPPSPAAKPGSVVITRLGPIPPENPFAPGDQKVQSQQRPASP